MEQSYSMGELFTMGGIWMYLISFFAVGAVVMTVIQLILRRKTKLIIWMWVMTALPLVIGIVGMLFGRHVVGQAVAGAAPEMIEELRRQGNAEATVPVYFGVIVFVCSAIPAALATALARRRQP